VHGRATGSRETPIRTLWADEIIGELPVPDDEFVEVSTDDSSLLHDLAPKLGVISQGQHHFQACRVVLGRVAVNLEREFRSKLDGFRSEQSGSATWFQV